MEVDDAQAQTFTLTAKVSEDKIVFTTEFQIIIVIVLIAIVVSILFIKFRRKKLKLKQSN
jgi:predicted permease